MAIQWYPGHMHKARKEIQARLPQVDLVIELLDARIPFSSENPMLKELVGDIPVLRVLTRSDLADELLTEQWLTEFHTDDTHQALAINTAEKADIRAVLERIAGTPDHRQAQRIKPRLALVAGIPNVGKSSLINALTGRHINQTGNEPAVTKRQQQTRLDDRWSLCDTPGVLWPKVENEASGYRLAATGAIRDTAMNSADVAANLVDQLLKDYPDRLKERFGQHLPMQDSLDALERIGQDRGCLGAGGLVDFDRVGRLMLQEFRSGKLGRITLETPAMRDEELEQTRQKQEQRETERKKRKEARLKKHVKKS